MERASLGRERTSPFPSPARPRRGAILTGGGTDGNERLTALAGALLFVLLAALGVTILRIGQLIWLHLFLGLLLLGPVAIKLASTGYRFARYYTGNGTYRRQGPPSLPLRLLAPLLVAMTLVVFLSGILLLADGPPSRDQYLFLHKASFVVWLGAAGLHVLGHLPTMLRVLGPGRSVPPALGSGAGAAGRWIALSGALIGGVVLAIVLIPDFGVWTSHAAVLHDHRR